MGSVAHLNRAVACVYECSNNLPMPRNIWSHSAFGHHLARLTTVERDRLAVREQEVVEESKRERTHERFIDAVLRAYGFKPFKREDQRNRPLRTKRSWVSVRARFREGEILTLKIVQGLTFRQIGNRLGISHVAAHKRFHWMLETMSMEAAHRAKCLEEVKWVLAQVDLLEERLAHLPFKERRKLLISMGLIPKRKVLFPVGT